MRTSPSKSLKRPPASITIAWVAATSHGFTQASMATSITPSATSMWDQKSPKARTTRARWSTVRNPCSPRRVAKSRTSVHDTYASSRTGVPETWMRCPEPVNAPWPVIAHQPDQRCPDRDTVGVVDRPVDGVEDPAPLTLRVATELLADDLLPRAQALQRVTKRLFGGAVGVGHRRAVGLGVDAQIRRTEARQRDRIGDVGELQRDLEV